MSFHKHLGVPNICANCNTRQMDLNKVFVLQRLTTKWDTHINNYLLTCYLDPIALHKEKEKKIHDSEEIVPGFSA